jgi:hypothetical protein
MLHLAHIGDFLFRKLIVARLLRDWRWKRIISTRVLSIET